eukprot:SAG11_NODE_8355_length_1025_cov_1.434125_1_plen_113_part_01
MESAPAPSVWEDPSDPQWIQKCTMIFCFADMLGFVAALGGCIGWCARPHANIPASAHASLGARILQVPLDAWTKKFIDAGGSGPQVAAAPYCQRVGNAVRLAGEVDYSCCDAR